MTTLDDDLKTAKDELQALQAELPNFHSLLTENEQDAQRLKSERAPLDEQAQAKGRVNVAREMLEQHQADIQSARAEVARLESLVGREATLEQMTTHAKTAAEHRNALDEAVLGAVADLQHAVGTILREWASFEAAKDAFVRAGAAELGSSQWPADPVSIGLRGAEVNQLRTRVKSVLEVIKERGADVSSLLEGDAVAIEYRTAHPLPAEGLAMLVWSAVLSLDEAPHSLKQQAPKPKGYVRLNAARGGGRYSI